MSPKDDAAQFEAYQLIKQLNEVVTDTMKHVAYGHLPDVQWREVVSTHRQAFEQWLAFAESKAVTQEMEQRREGMRHEEQHRRRELMMPVHETCEGRDRDG
ncbi:hypothetical protein G7007_04560 [Pseudomonas entomophila]|jgi:hypothetical protein|uniref:hypothetical protein n=1 Tax=Pseudomonas entomophila TaxID=312306 RepID=UPI0015E2B737|nr:hypothetical protein [Pseudomonas entomophila]MBA1192137.1 hypothetical protein [Pseudomonas entomophila]